MGTLTPGATYVYERVGEVVYAREFGSSERKVIGWSYNMNNDPILETTKGNSELALHNQWIKIRLAGKNNPALQKAIDNVILIYKLTVPDNE